ncbi:hypothetical protein M5K25_021350 [Dendrobium thyrsiflorum]|uniref:Aminotransferase-like plant mobile domain-containing protein n=1 Tax=Dendrobium thyrsiflorum TaxID=117978 RepID=A0ABD0UCM3_DENTH
MGIWNWKFWAFENGEKIFKIGNCTILHLKRMVGEWMMDPIKIPWFRRPGSSWSLVYLVRGGSRPNLTEGSLSAAMGCFVQGPRRPNMNYKINIPVDDVTEMFRWQRPDDFPPGEPSEAVIWDAIDRHDPRGDADVRDRLEQHQDMLQGRDVFHSFFARSHLLPECPPESVGFEDPSQWVSSLRLQCGEYHPLESSIAPVSWGTCDILEPAADTVEPSPVSGYVHWARYVLQAHKSTLQTAGIYKAVYASLFDYGRLPSSWARGLVEFWDAGRGTCWIGAEEFTVTLSDLQTVSGLPVFGHHFEECVPPDEQLFQRVPSADGDRRGMSVLPDVYPVALQHYRQTFRASDLSRRARASMPADVWVRSFLQEGYLSTVGVSLHDPFGLGLQRGTVLSEETAEPTFTSDCTSLGLPGVREDLLLVGFLALWLSTFVLPLRTGSLRCSVLLAASQLASGQRLSLAPAVLARVYRVLRTLSEASSLEVRDLVLPWQYLYAWVHLHVQGAFSCLETPGYFLQRGYPTVLQLFQASSTLESERIRLFFFAPQSVTDRFALVHQPDTRGTVVVDGVDRRGRRTLLLRRQSLAVAEYFISIRPGWLCYRAGAVVTLEGYQPNRVARQFGYSQATALDGRPVVPGVTDVLHMETVPQETRFFTAALTWLHLLRLGTGSSFLLAQPSSSTGVSFTRLTWVRLSFGPALEHGARRYEPRVRELGSSRGRRPRRGSPVATFERGTDTEAHTTARAAAPSSPRATGVAPEPLYTETARSPRRHASSPRASSPRMPVGVHSSPGRASSPRMPVGVHTSPGRASSPRMPVGVHTSPGGPRESSPRLRGSDPTSFSTLDPPDDYFCPAYPGESSGAGADIVAEFSFFPEGHPTDFAGPSSAPASFPAGSASPSTALEGFEYASEISCHVPLLPDSRSADRCSHTAALLKDLIFSIDPRSPASWIEFVPTADRLLGVLASFGVTLPELEERVTRRREAADDTHDRFDSSAVALRRHRESTSRMDTEVSELTTRVRSLWRDIKEVMSKKTDVEERRGRRGRLTSREEQRYLALQ